MLIPLYLLLIPSVSSFEPPKAAVFNTDEDVPVFNGLYGREPRGQVVAEGVALRKSAYGVTPLKEEYRVDAVKESSVQIPPAPGPSLGYQPPPPPVRREIAHSSNCSFEPEKWSLHVDTSISRAIMFERTTGGNCEDCLQNCTLRQSSPWVCRSIVYDSRWDICDLFAVTASAAPFDLVEFEGRQYMEYLPAMPPTDSEFKKLVKIADRDQSTKASCQPMKQSEKATVREGREGGLYGAVPVEEQLTTEEKTRALEKKREEKRKMKQEKIEKPSVDAVTSTTTTTTTTDASTTEETTTEGPEKEVTDRGRTTIGNLRGEKGNTAGEIWGETQESLTTVLIEEEIDKEKLLTTIKPRRISYKPKVPRAFHQKLVPSADRDEESEKEAVSSCTDDDVVAMVEFISTARKRPIRAELKKKKATSAEACSESCQEDEDCSSALFDGDECELATTKSRRARTDLSTVSGSTYVEKVCLRQIVAKDRGTLFSAVRNFILHGFVEEVEDARSMEDCIGMCLKANKKHGFDCLSAMWYPGDKQQNCVLNSEAGSRKPENFKKAEQSIQMVYIEIPDAVDVKKEKTKKFKRKDDPLPKTSKWTVWSSCDGKEKDHLRYRYQKCAESFDVRKCPKESAFCGPNPFRGPKVRHLLDSELRH